MKRFLILALLAAPLPAFAHAYLQSAVPAVGATVSAAPSQLVMNFTEGLETAFCSVTVTNAAGQAVNDGKAVRGDDEKQLVVKLRTLPAGTYHVVWRAVSVDTHHTSGDFHFTVKGG
jgi:methionine-rich copper-binding protein CopC